MANNGSRFHIEVTGIKAADELSVRFNIFADTLPQAVADLEQVMAYVNAAVPPPSYPLPAAGARAAAPSVPSVAPKAPAGAKTGTCIGCGSDTLEWVTGTRKDNGKSFAAFKCQECGKWQPEAKK